ncbi:MAG: hypothetical protein ACYDBJ_05685 [Aggregatilineales bacterium]
MNLNLGLSAAQTARRTLARYPLQSLLAVYVTLAVLYGAVTPIFETPDESTHYAVSQHIALTGQLPVQSLTDPLTLTPWMQEGSQPPLYYLLTAPIAALVPGALDNPYPLALNPHAKIGIGLATNNHNKFIHTAAESFPWRGVALAVHLIRLISTLLGAWTVFCVYRMARCVWPEARNRAIIAAAFVALNPMFLFIHASANNDALITALSATALWMTIYLYLTTTWRERGIVVVVALSVVLAAAAISKVSGLALYAVAGAGLLIALLKGRLTFWQAAKHLLVWAVGFAVIAAWWYVRNAQLYGDPTGLRAMLAIADPRRTPYTISSMLSEMEGLRISSWGLFGWLNVIGPAWFYTVMDILTAAALIGGILGAVRIIYRADWDQLAVIGVLSWEVCVMFVSLFNWTRQTPGTQGRLLFPALPALALLTAFGWETLFRRRWSKVALAPLAFVAIVAPLAIIAPAYTPPAPIAFDPPASVSQALPPDALPVNAEFDSISMYGIRIGSQPIAPSDSLPVTLYYGGLPDPRNFTLFLTIYDCQKNVIAKLDSYPGGGMLPTSQWVKGAVYADSYLLPLERPATLPCQPYVEFGWWNYATGQYLTNSADPAQPHSVTVRGGVVIDPAAPVPTPAVAQTATFGDAIQFLGYTLDSTTVAPKGCLRLTLVWQGLAPVANNLTIFVHLERADTVIVGQGDSPPLNGDYPTPFWAIGRAFSDPHTVCVSADATPGTYRLSIGWYRPETSTRLPVNAGDTLTLNTPITVSP